MYISTTLHKRQYLKLAGDRGIYTLWQRELGRPRCQ
uniref:Uncharacterized protein n=1 Tax=Rhizophora mucronata TaxID=61149 RepID=A0A2P2J7I4_RHIMU